MEADLFDAVFYLFPRNSHSFFNCIVFFNGIPGFAAFAALITGRVNLFYRGIKAPFPNYLPQFVHGVIFCPVLSILKISAMLTGPSKRLTLPTIRAGHMPVENRITVIEVLPDIAFFNGWRGKDKDFAVIFCFGSLCGKGNRIGFFRCDIISRLINLIQHHNAKRSGGEFRNRGGPGDSDIRTICQGHFVPIKRRIDNQRRKSR